MQNDNISRIKVQSSANKSLPDTRSCVINFAVFIDVTKNNISQVGWVENVFVARIGKEDQVTCSVRVQVVILSVETLLQKIKRTFKKIELYKRE